MDNQNITSIKHGIDSIAENERPRERLLRYGVSSLSNSELLAIIISSGTRAESSIDLANHILLMEQGNIAAFSNYHPEELQKIKGIGKAKACSILASIEFGKRVANTPLLRQHMDTPSQVAVMCDDMRHFQKEVLRVVMFNVKMDVVCVEDVSIGVINGSSASPREVFANAVRKGVYGIILVHNHPSGDPSPSSSDVDATRLIVSSGKILGIEVLDHIIVGDGSFYSFRQENML